MRGAVLSATTRKVFGYIQLADSKAAGLIVMNSLIVPVALSGFDNDHFKLAATLAILTSICSMLFAILCIFPQRGMFYNKKNRLNLLHFKDIGQMDQDEYLDIFNPIYNDPSKLGETVLKDIHDVSQRVLMPKFLLLKIAYTVFFLGNLAAIILVLFNIWS